MKTRLELATKADIGFIQELERNAFGFTWDETTFQKELSRTNGFTTVLWSGQERIGSALVVWAVDEAQLNSIVVSPEHRGKGFSICFLGGLLAHCQEQNMAWMTLEVKWTNEPAHSLYRKFGFVTTACRKRYYRDGKDARIMWAGHLQTPTFIQRLSKFQETAASLRRSA